MKNNKKGFTLIELLAVLVIMGLIIMMAFPTVARLINSNDDETFEQYNNLVKEAALSYSNTVKSELGGVNDIGCSTVTLKTLEDQEFLTLDDGDMTCKIKTTTDGTEIKIRNDHGNISANYVLTCTKNGKTFQNTVELDNDECKAYTVDQKDSLFTKLSSDSRLTTSEDGRDVYITNGTYNYVKYSGRLWRVVSYNKVSETVKVVADDNVSVLRYNNSGSLSFIGSDIETWLNNDFLKTLNEPKTYVASTTWKISSDVSKQKIGLLSSSEYDKVKSWYSSSTYSSYYMNNNNSWLLDSSSSGVYIVSSSKKEEVDAKGFYAVRPALSLNSELYVYSGNGTKDKPYIIEEEGATASVGDKLNTRYSGEFISVHGLTFRIVSTSSNGTKVISTVPLYYRAFSEDSTSAGSLSYLYDSSSLGVYLEENISGFASEKTEYCMDEINEHSSFVISTKCNDSTLVTTQNVGIPKIGDFYTTGMEYEYWTLNPYEVDTLNGTYENSKINTVTANNTLSNDYITEPKRVYIVSTLDKTYKITSGTGSYTAPYIISN